MDLAKQTVDVGIFTNNLEAMQELLEKLSACRLNR